MTDCCENKSCAIEAMKIKQAKVLKIVFWINVCLFMLTVTCGLVVNSASLLTESLDDLGDAITYALSLYVVYKSDKAKAKVALFKGLLILFGALFVLSQAISHAINQNVPLFEPMGVVAVIALLGNLTCLYLLTKHKEQDINMSSIWECSKNDILNNLSIIAAAVIVWITNVGWADVLVGFILSVLLIKSSIKVIKSALTNI
jgi:cation diffusion facilitator family transporter